MKKTIEFAMALAVVLVAFDDPGRSWGISASPAAAASDSCSTEPEPTIHSQIVFSSTQYCPDDPRCAQYCADNPSECVPEFAPDIDAGFGELYVMDENGARQRRLTFNTTTDLGAVYSPDGRTIAFYSPVAGTPQLFLMNADGTGRTQLTNLAVGAQFPSWSPDGQKIVFHSNRRPRDVFVINVDGTALTNLTETFTIASTTQLSDDSRADWSPDGSKIAFMSDQADPDVLHEEVYVMNADGSEPSRLTFTPNKKRAQAPDWSPDGTKIVFQSDRDEPAFDIFVVNADGTDVRNLTPTPPGATCPRRDLDAAWSLDGTVITFDSDRSNCDQVRQLWVINADGTCPTQLTGTQPHDTGESGHAGWGPR